MTTSILTILLLASMQKSAAPAVDVDYCSVETQGTRVLVQRPAEGEAVVDDVNWFARPVPNPEGRWIVGFASHDQNYLYDLSRGRRIRIPDRSDAVATPDGLYVTVPSHYTPNKTVNFYDASVLLARLDEGKDAADVAPVFAHEDEDVADVYYQSVGVVSERRDASESVTVYRMMFSGSRVLPAPGFRIVDYTFTSKAGRLSVSPTKAMRLCPQITRDLATPFISKDGRHVVAHDGGSDDQPGSLKIFEITGVDPEAQTTSCELRFDFGFAAGKADFSFDGRRVTFHISKHNYLTPFINGGIEAPSITDVVVADLLRDEAGRFIGHGGLARVTTSTKEGIGSYFPAFFPDGNVFYLASTAPKNSADPKRFRFFVVDPEREIHFANVFADPARRDAADKIGRLWLASCAPEMKPFRMDEAPWAFMSLSRVQCERLVQERWTGDAATKSELLDLCAQPRAR